MFAVQDTKAPKESVATLNRLSQVVLETERKPLTFTPMNRVLAINTKGKPIVVGSPAASAKKSKIRRNDQYARTLASFQSASRTYQPDFGGSIRLSAIQGKETTSFHENRLVQKYGQQRRLQDLI